MPAQVLAAARTGALTQPPHPSRHPTISVSQISKDYSAPPYITTPPTAPINIDVGRQLFCDPFLVGPGSSGIVTVHHTAQYRDEVNPVLAPTGLAWEGRCVCHPPGTPKSAGCQPCANHTQYMELAFASAFSGGLWWDPADSIYKMW